MNAILSGLMFSVTRLIKHLIAYCDNEIYYLLLLWTFGYTCLNNLWSESFYYTRISQTQIQIHKYFQVSVCDSIISCFILKFCPHVSCVAFSSCPFSVFTCLLFVYIVCVLPHVFISSSCVTHLFLLQWIAVSPRDVLCFLFLSLFLEFFLTWSMLFVAL